jgi:hypothetical protein
VSNLTFNESNPIPRIPKKKIEEVSGTKKRYEWERKISKFLTESDCIRLNGIMIKRQGRRELKRVREAREAGFRSEGSEGSEGI